MAPTHRGGAADGRHHLLGPLGSWNGSPLSTACGRRRLSVTNGAQQAYCRRHATAVRDARKPPGWQCIMSYTCPFGSPWDFTARQGAVQHQTTLPPSVFLLPSSSVAAIRIADTLTLPARSLCDVAIQRVENGALYQSQCALLQNHPPHNPQECCGP